MQKVEVSDYSKLSTPGYCERALEQILPLLAHVGVVVQYSILCACTVLQNYNMLPKGLCAIIHV
jgi:hypothetical protein